MESVQESENWTPASEDLLNSQYPVHRACRDGDISALSLLLTSSEVDLYQEDGFYGWTPIHWAAHFGKLACLRKLVIERSVGLDSLTSKFSQSALHLASQSGHPHCVQWLVQTGASTLIQDYMGETALHKCARTGNMECVSLLLSQGAKLSIRNHNGQTPSHLAAECGHQECAAYIERAAQIEQAQGVYGIPSINPSLDLRVNGAVTNGNAIDDVDMETDLMSSSYRVNPLAGIKRGRDDFDDDECKKSRRDEPTSWIVQNPPLFGGTNDGFMGNNHMKPNVTNGFAHLNEKFQNGYQSPPNGVHYHSQNGFPITPNGVHVNGSNHRSGNLGVCGSNHSVTINNNSICVSTSTEEHLSTITQEQGYDSLVMQSFGNQYDGS